MNLILDLGNSSCKIAVFDNHNPVHIVKIQSGDNAIIETVLSVFDQYPNIGSGILSSVINHSPELESKVKLHVLKLLVLTHETPLPIANCYHSASIGKDRLAAAVGANNIFRNSNVLVIDAGTAITFDFIDKRNQFLGGNISPGLSLRFRALNSFTQKLPLANTKPVVPLLANDTENAIVAGVQNGVIFECRNYISELEKLYGNIQIVFTGGDGQFLASFIHKDVFTDPDLVLKGLNIILEHNDNLPL